MLTASPLSTMDPLSDVLRAVRLNGAYFYMVEAAAPWSIFTAGGEARSAGATRRGTPHLVSYPHVGNCLGRPRGESQVKCNPATRSSSRRATRT